MSGAARHRGAAWPVARPADRCDSVRRMRALVCLGITVLASTLAEAKPRTHRLEVTPATVDYGYNGCNGYLPENCERDLPARILQLNRQKMTAEFEPGVVIPLRPFYGSMGVAPAPEAGRVSSVPPGRHAGNLDNRELVAGSTLYIPIFVKGALFEIGDGHGAQGDGEVDQTALETSLRGRVQLTVRKGKMLLWPRAETATDYISMASNEDL